MNARQAKWIVKKLCPFILREQGRGFAMSPWSNQYAPGFTIEFDGATRKVPSCGTICCIGGSIDALNALKGVTTQTSEECGRLIGLDKYQVTTLFYGWDSTGDAWPRPYISRYEKAKTPLAKARVAVSLLKLVAKTRGKCLNEASP